MDGRNGRVVESAFDLPPQFALVERRRAGIAEGDWRRAGRAMVAGFENHSVIVDDPGGTGRLRRVGLAVTDTFGLFADMTLTRHDAIGAELCAACDLIALRPEPLHFEASLMAPRLHSGARRCLADRGRFGGADHPQLARGARPSSDGAVAARFDDGIATFATCFACFRPVFDQIRRELAKTAGLTQTAPCPAKWRRRISASVSCGAATCR